MKNKRYWCPFLNNIQCLCPLISFANAVKLYNFSDKVGLLINEANKDQKDVSKSVHFVYAVV